MVPSVESGMEGGRKLGVYIVGKRVHDVAGVTRSFI